MENDPFIDDFPINTSIYKGFSMAMLNNQMVCNSLPEGKLFTIVLAKKNIPDQRYHPFLYPMIHANCSWLVNYLLVLNVGNGWEWGNGMIIDS